MIIALSGSSGFIGQALLKKFRDRGWTTRIIGRDALTDPAGASLDQVLEGSDVVINLAGAPISKKWTAAYKDEIVSSRVDTTRKIVAAMGRMSLKPLTFISFSATGIYDSVNTHTETSTQFAGSFLAGVCRSWEAEAMQSTTMTRVVIFRTGIVLGSEGGALKSMHCPFSIGLGGKIGNGRQAVSFIHIADLAGAILFAIENESVKGIINAVTPYPSNNAEFSECLAKVLGQPCWLTFPAFALKLIMGEGAVILLEGQKVLPEKLEQAGFRFRYPTILNALVQIYG